jgi:hypothetical protein
MTGANPCVTSASTPGAPPLPGILTADPAKPVGYAPHISSAHEPKTNFQISLGEKRFPSSIFQATTRTRYAEMMPRYNSRNRYLTIDGETKTLREWAHVSGNDETLIWHRIKAGRPVEDAVFDEPRKYANRGHQHCRTLKEQEL